MRGNIFKNYTLASVVHYGATWLTHVYFLYADFGGAVLMLCEFGTNPLTSPSLSFIICIMKRIFMKLLQLLCMSMYEHNCCLVWWHMLVTRELQK